jgi:hypothetical protein
MSNHTTPSRLLAIGVLALAAIGATGCNRDATQPPPPSTTTPSGSTSTSPMPPASAASQ